MTTSDDDVLETLSQTSAAEEFFEVLGVEYDPKVVNVARLHILRRMGEYLYGNDLDGLSNDEVKTRCKEFLEQAYADFQKSTPIDERLFKVHKEAVQTQEEPETPASFVSIEDLK